MSGMSSDTGNERLLPGLVPAGSLPTSAPSRRNMAAGVPVGDLLYIVSVGLVTMATIGVFFGIGFFLLAQPTEEPIAAAAPLPVSLLSQRPAVGEALPQQESNSAQGSVPVSRDGEVSASAARAATPSEEVLARGSTSDDATIIAPAQTASAPEPEPSPPASSAPAPEPASPRVFAAEIAKFLATQHAPAANEVITFEQYRDFRIHDLTQRRARLTQQLAAPNLSAAEKKRLERRKSDYDRLAAMPAEEGDRHFRERFDEIDANHDGKLDPEELAVWREKQRVYYQQQATERAVNRSPPAPSPQPLRRPQAGQTNPFASAFVTIIGAGRLVTETCANSARNIGRLCFQRSAWER
jgi:hypothetical protein